jgi:DNA-binding MarR family transcriptional regulator
MDTECICMAVREAGRRLTARYDENLAPFGIGVAQFSLLRRIHRQSPVSLTELGRRTELDRSTLGRNVRVLERLGLVETVAGADKRASMLQLTPEGARTLEQAMPVWEKTQAEVAGLLQQGDTDQLLNLLNAF